MLQKNFRLFYSRTNEDLKNFMEGGKGDITMNVTIDGGDQEGVMKTLPVLKDAMLEALTADIASGGTIMITIKTYS